MVGSLGGEGYVRNKLILSSEGMAFFNKYEMKNVFKRKFNRVK